MNCVRCGRPMDKAAAWVGDMPIGPKCFTKMFAKKARKVSVEVVVCEQPDLFAQPDLHPVESSDEPG